MKVSEVLKVTRGRLASGSPDREIEPSRISTDSRSLKRGGLFIALKGANFDGSSFVKEAFAKGACGVILSGEAGVIAGDGKVVIRVEDTCRALEDIAAHNRAKFSGPVIAVTGSNGKTTVKDMIWTVLSSKYRVLKNEGTKNNNIGVSQTLLGLSERHDACVLELGANHAGEIMRLAEIARPTMGVMTNIGHSHLEFFGDLAGVFRAKTELVEALRGGARLILNQDDEYLRGIAPGRLKIIKYGLSKASDFFAESIRVGYKKVEFTLSGRAHFRLSVLGIHNVYNALAAIAVGKQFGIGYDAMKMALARFKPASMRLGPERIGGIDIINDSYNSNPLSMRSALEAIRHYPARTRWVVSGDMLELGRSSVRLHRMAGEEIAGSGIDGLLTFGRLSRHTLARARVCGMKGDSLRHCSSHGEIAGILKKVLKKGDAVLLKGSRGMRMEEVIRLFNDK